MKDTLMLPCRQICPPADLIDCFSAEKVHNIPAKNPRVSMRSKASPCTELVFASGSVSILYGERKWEQSVSALISMGESPYLFEEEKTRCGEKREIVS